MSHLVRAAVAFVLLAGAVAPVAGEVEGEVIDANGKPASGIAVLLVEPGDNPDIFNGQLGNLYGADLASTDEAGRFHFAATPTSDYRLIALGDDGYGESDVLHVGDAVPAVTLGPWATIEGVAMVGGESCPGAPISGVLDEPLTENWSIAPAADHWIDTNAGPDGRFKLDHLKPGRWRVAQEIPFAPGGRPYPSHPQRYDVIAGETTSVTIGGEGRAVIGRAVLPKLDPPAEVRLAMLQNDWTTVDNKPPATFGEVQEMTPAERDALVKTDAFRAYAARLDADKDRRQFYVVTVQPDGSFRADDVPPGEYGFYIEMRQPGNGGAKLAVERNIVVPSSEDDAPFDLGTLPMKPIVNLATGEVVPDVTFKTVDGEQMSLSDFRGKYVLLDVWATWCGPCIGETPNILAVQKAFADDDRFVIIGLSMDDGPDAPRRYTEAKGLTWTNGFIGQWDKTEVDDALGVGGIPDIRLIGPDGKLVAKGLRGDEIHQAVADALAAVK